MKTSELNRAYYEPSGTYEMQDENGIYYNRAGDQLRDPEEYDTSSEGYTPFGDE